MKKAKPNKDVARIIEANEVLSQHRLREQELIKDMQYLACKALNNSGQGRNLKTQALVDDCVYEVSVFDRGKAVKGAPGRPRLRYKTEITPVQSN